VGETVTVTQVIADGSGRVKLGDSEWLARGPDAEPGTKMRVASHDGAVLVVEYLH
jgi:membrane protein implicated in regulation of membrane protease activity